MAGMANMPQTVSATKAESSDWQPKIDAVGSLRAVRGAELSLEVPGVVEEHHLPVGRRGEGGAGAAAPCARRTKRPGFSRSRPRRSSRRSPTTAT